MDARTHAGGRVDRQQEYVLRTVEERGVRLIRLWFTDVLGKLKSVAISPAELESAFEEGMRAGSRQLHSKQPCQPDSAAHRSDRGTSD